MGLEITKIDYLMDIMFNRSKSVAKTIKLKQPAKKVKIALTLGVEPRIF